LDNDLHHDLQIYFDTQGKRLTVDGKNINRAIDYCRFLSVVAFSPDEMRMVDGTPELRRRFLDRAIFSCNSDYLRIYHNYFRVLKQRNQLLRHRNYTGLDAWTEQLVVTGARLVSVRNSFVAELAEGFSEYYRDISGSDEEGRLCYHANSLHDLRDETEIMNQLYAALSESSCLERERGVTLKGPHRDDLDFILNGKPIREHGSQGQQKSFVIAMKMAEIENARRKTGNPPVLLLDDVTSELDGTRSLHLLNFLTERNIQVFITATDHNMVPFTKEQDISCFYVENGRIVQKGN
jgi:DNA replication and repair protein RecF